MQTDHQVGLVHLICKGCRISDTRLLEWLHHDMLLDLQLQLQISARTHHRVLRVRLPLFSLPLSALCLDICLMSPPL